MNVLILIELQQTLHYAPINVMPHLPHQSEVGISAGDLTGNSDPTHVEVDLSVYYIFHGIPIPLLAYQGLFDLRASPNLLFYPGQLFCMHGPKTPLDNNITDRNTSSVG